MRNLIEKAEGKHLEEMGGSDPIELAISLLKKKLGFEIKKQKDLGGGKVLLYGESKPGFVLGEITVFHSGDRGEIGEKKTYVFGTASISKAVNEVNRQWQKHLGIK